MSEIAREIVENLISANLIRHTHRDYAVEIVAGTVERRQPAGERSIELERNDTSIAALVAEARGRAELDLQLGPKGIQRLCTALTAESAARGRGENDLKIVREQQKEDFDIARNLERRIEQAREALEGAAVSLEGFHTLHASDPHNSDSYCRVMDALASLDSVAPAQAFCPDCAGTGLISHHATRTTSECLTCKRPAQTGPVEGTWAWALAQACTERSAHDSRGRVVQRPHGQPITINDDGQVVCAEGGRPASFDAEDFDAMDWARTDAPPEE